MERIASRINQDGMLVVPVDEIADEELDRAFAENPDLATVTGVPRYWAPKYGYWPKPGDGWRVT